MASAIDPQRLDGRVASLVQRHAMATWDEGGSLRERVSGCPEIGALLSPEEIERVFSLEEALRHVGAIFERTLAAEFEPSGTEGTS